MAATPENDTRDKADRKSLPPKSRTSAPRAPKSKAKLTEGEIQRRLAAIEPSWAGKPPGRFANEIAKGHASWKKLQQALGDSDPLVRADAAWALAEVGAWEAVEALKKLLDDPSTTVCSNAALALIKLGDKPLIQEMVRTLREPDPSTAAGAATALGMARNRELVPHLLAAFGTKNEELGAAIAIALGQMEDPRALEALFASLRAGFVPVEVCEALGRIADPSARPLLLKTLKHPSPDVRASAARALSLIERKARKVDASFREGKLIPALRALLDDAKPRVRLSAALALHELGDRDAAPILYELLEEA